MKLILLIFITFNSYASGFLHVDKSNPKDSDGQIKSSTEIKANNKLKKIILENKSSLKGVWKIVRVNSIFSNIFDVDVFDEDGFKIGSEKVKKYYHPTNFSILWEDTTKKDIDNEKEKSDRKTEIKEIKKMIKKINDSNYPAWHKRILKHQVRDMRE